MGMEKLSEGIFTSAYMYANNIYDEKNRSNIITDILLMLEAEGVYPIWLCRTIMRHKANGSSNYTKRDLEALRRQAVDLSPLNNNGQPMKCHDREWRDDIVWPTSKPSTRHIVARAT